jgi:hypothetical protein
VVVCDTALLVNHPHKPVFGGGIQHHGAAFTFTLPIGKEQPLAPEAEEFGVDE